jgi:hypothetical protein
MGLIIFYDLTRVELQGRRPLAKFLCIKLIVMFTWYQVTPALAYPTTSDIPPQGFIFSILQSKGIIRETGKSICTCLEHLLMTSIRILDSNQRCPRSECARYLYRGSSRLLSAEILPSETAQMVFFAIFMHWAYPYKEYLTKGQGKTSIWRPLWDSINFSDFAYEIWTSFRFFFDYMRGKPHTRSPKDHPGGTSFGDAFRLEKYNEQSTYGWVSPTQKHQHNRQGFNEMQTARDDSSEALNIRVGMQGAYHMKYISSQPSAFTPWTPETTVATSRR